MHLQSPHTAAPGTATASGLSAAEAGRAVAVVLHDVAPARWPGCLRVMAQVQHIARQAGVALPVTLLVVPQFHGETPGPHAQHYLRWLRRQSRDGHEMALHGLTHRDESPPGRGLRDHAMRRWYTAGEGEFATLDRAEAERRLALGRAWADGLGLSMPGFVAPAWLLSPAALDAVAAGGFRYTCTLTELVRLPSRSRLRCRSLVFSTRSGWRRGLSVVWNTLVAAQQQGSPLLRLELHPGDADHTAVRDCWSRVLAGALRDRRPICLSQAAA